eukprot:5319938-Pleurochrysis_carterae.AAC.1
MTGEVLLLMMMMMLLLMLMMPLQLLLLAYLSAGGRHAATFKLECIRLRHQIDEQRNTINNLKAEMANLDKGAVRALRARDHAVKEVEAKQLGAAAAAADAQMAYETNVKQQQTDANVKYKALLLKEQNERNAASAKVTKLEAYSTQLQRMINRANAAARAANKANAAAVSELEAQ